MSSETWKVIELQNQLKEAVEVIRFYGNLSSWKKSNAKHFTLIIQNDRDLIRNKKMPDEVYYPELEIGGKMARNFLLKIKDKGPIDE